MNVNAASRIVSAISFGVFWRRAPSTRAIILSRNPAPLSAVTRTMMRSLSTRVPPVTALRSPPLSRITGADSPVIAASSTLAIPSTTSPSAGITSPASHTTRSPFFNAGAGTFSSRPFFRRRAIVSLRARRRLAACALPRPSATASAKIGKKTGKPRQDGQRRHKAGRLRVGLEKAHSRYGSADHGNKHDRVLQNQRRVQLFERVANSRTNNVPVEERCRFLRHRAQLRTNGLVSLTPGFSQVDNAPNELPAV